MIKGIIRSNFSGILNWKILLFYAFYVVFSFLTKIAALQNDLNFFEYVCETLCNQHNIVYFVMPIYFIVVFNLLTEVSDFTIVRVGKFKRYFISKCCSYLAISSFMVSGILFLLFIMGLGLPFENKYDITLKFSNHYIGPSFLDICATPLHLIVLQITHMIFGLTFISIIAEALFVFLRKKGILLLIFAIDYTFTVFSASGKIGTSFLLINSYLTPSNIPYFFAKAFFIEAIGTIALLMIVCKYWHKKIYDFNSLFLVLKNWNFKKLISKKFIYVSIILAILTNILLYTFAKATSLVDYIYLQLIGYGTGYFSILPFTALLITMCTPLFFQSYFLQEQFQNSSCFVKIRYKSKLTYMKQLLGIFLFFTIVYVIVLSIVSLAGGVIIGLESGITEYPDLINLLPIMLKSMLLKCLEIYMILLFSLSIFIYTKKIGLSFFIPIAGYLTNIFNFNLNKFNPFGISSALRWMQPESNISFALALTILCTMNIILITFLVFRGQKRII